MKVENTSPLVKDGKRLTRRFLGNLFPKTVFEKNELKAYLKGKTHFTYKNNSDNYHLHKVRQEYFYI